MAKQTITEATTSLYELLKPFKENERSKIVTAALILLGQSPVEPRSSAHSETSKSIPLGTRQEAPTGIGPKAARWMAQNGINEEILEQWFDLAPDQPEVVADVPGGSDREKVVNCYLLVGLATFLKTDDVVFTDAAARGLCVHSGCYDANNHNKYIKFGNRVTGDKKNGWKLLGPGLKDGAALVKRAATGSAE